MSLYKGSSFAQSEEGNGFVQLSFGALNSPNSVADKDTIVIFIRGTVGEFGAYTLEQYESSGWRVDELYIAGQLYFAVLIRTWRTGDTVNPFFQVQDVSNPSQDLSNADINLVATGYVLSGITIVNPVDDLSFNQATSTSSHQANAVNVSRAGGAVLLGLGSTTTVGMGNITPALEYIGAFVDALSSWYQLNPAVGLVGGWSVPSSGFGNHVFASIGLGGQRNPSVPTGISLNPVQPDTITTVSYTKGSDPEQELIVTCGDLSTDGGVNYSPFFMSEPDANSAQANFGNAIATNNAFLRVYSKAGNRVSGYTVFGPFTIQHPPTQPIITNPVNNGTRTKGVAFNIAWERSTSSVYPANQLKYEVQISNAGNTELAYRSLGITALNANTFPYDFATDPLGNNNWIRIKAIDPVGRVSAWRVVGPFTIAADVNPQAPINLRGEQGALTIGSGGSFDRLSSLRLRGDFNDPGDDMDAQEIRWGTNGSTYPNTTGVLASTALDRTFAANTFPRQDIFFQFFTRDRGNKWNLAPGLLTLKAGEKPAPPVFVTPTNGMNFPGAIVNAEWTSVGQQAFELILTDQADAVLWSSGVQVSAVTVWGVPPQLINGRTYKLKLSIRNSEQLWSNQTVVTFTVVFAQPPVPVVTIVLQTGYPEVRISNPSNGAGVDKNALYRYIVSKGIASAIRIAENIAVGSSTPAIYNDKTCPPNVQVGYFARAENATTLLFSENRDTPAITTLILKSVYLTIMDGTNRMFEFVAFRKGRSKRTAGAITPVDGVNSDGTPMLPVASFVKNQQEAYALSIICKKGTNMRANLLTVYEALSTVCFRHPSSDEAIFIAWHEFAENFAVGGSEFEVPINRVRYIEDLELLNRL